MPDSSLLAQLSTDAFSSGWAGLALVFAAAATPWLEILIVIPAAVAAGLPPWPVAVLAWLGNTLPVLGIVAAYDWWRGRRRNGSDDSPPSRRRQRAQRLMNRYGLPGLALLGPLVTGIHLAAVLALALASPRRAVAVWMSASLALWTVGITVVSVMGRDALFG